MANASILLKIVWLANLIYKDVLFANNVIINRIDHVLKILNKDVFSKKINLNVIFVIIKNID